MEKESLCAPRTRASGFMRSGRPTVLNHHVGMAHDMQVQMPAEVKAKDQDIKFALPPDDDTTRGGQAPSARAAQKYKAAESDERRTVVHRTYTFT